MKNKKNLLVNKTESTLSGDLTNKRSRILKVTNIKKPNYSLYPNEAFIEAAQKDYKNNKTVKKKKALQIYFENSEKERLKKCPEGTTSL